MVKKGCLGCLGVVVVLCGGSFVFNYVKNTREQSRVNKIQEDRHFELESFSREFIPEVYRAIKELDLEISRREAALEKLSEELAKVGRVASQDKDFKRWQKKISDLGSMRADMIARRDDVFVAHQKFNYDPDSDESQKQIEALMGPADREAENVLRDLEKLRSDS